MALSKREMADLILARVGGGLPTDDLAIKRIEVMKLLPPAINYQAIGDYRVERRLNQQDRTSADWNAPMSSFMGNYHIEVEVDKDRDLRFITFEGGFMDLPNNRGISHIFPLGSSGTSFHMVKSHREVIGLHPALLRASTFFWIESLDGEDRVYFKGISNLVKTVVVRAAVDMENLDDDHKLPIPDHIAFAAMELCVQWFVGERQMPEQLVNNNKDDK